MRNYKAQLFVAAFATIIALPMPVLAHSGGTDSSGCHTNRKTRRLSLSWRRRAACPHPAPFFGSGQRSLRELHRRSRSWSSPVYRGDPGYGPHLDRDNDGIGCE